MPDDTDAHRKYRQSVLTECKRRLADDHLCNALERLDAAEYASVAGRKPHNKAVTVAIGMNELCRDHSVAELIRSHVRDAVRSVPFHMIALLSLTAWAAY